MVVHIICYVFLCLNAILYNANSEKHNEIFKKFIFFLSCAFITFLMCFRDISIGADTRTYFQYFKIFQKTDFLDFESFTFEPGFVLLNRILGYVINDARWFIIAFGLINLLPVFGFIKKNSTCPAMSLLIFYAMFFKSAEYILRQWIAVMILFIAYKFVIEKKPFRFIVVCLFAVLFHRTAILFLIVYPLQYIKIKGMTLLLSGASSVFLFVTADFWKNLFNRFARIELISADRGGEFMLIFLWVALLVVYWILKDDVNLPNNKLYFTMLWVAAVSQPLSLVIPLWSRALIYFRMALIFILPVALKKYATNEKNSKYAFLVDLVFCGLLFVLFYMNGIENFVLYGRG